jgi:hypothetical protein
MEQGPEQLVPRPEGRPRGTLSRAIALVLVSLGLAFLFHRFDASALAKIDSMAPGELVRQQREQHLHSPLFWFACTLVMGAIYLGVMDLATQLVRSVAPKR